MATQLTDDASAVVTARPVAPWSGFAVGAVLAGIALAIAAHLALTLLGAAIGFSTVDPIVRETPSGRAFAFTAGAWWMITSWIALFCGAWLASALSRAETPRIAALHGVIIWAVTTILGLGMLGSALTGVIAGTARMVGGAAAAGTEAIAAAAPGVAQSATPSLDRAWDSLRRDVENAAQQRANAATARPLPARSIASLAEGYFRPTGGKPAPEARERLVAALSAEAGATTEEADRTVREWERVYAEARTAIETAQAQAEQRAREAADASAKALAIAAFWAFAASVLGLVAACVGGALGRTYDGDGALARTTVYDMRVAP